MEKLLKLFLSCLILLCCQGCNNEEVAQSNKALATKIFNEGVDKHGFNFGYQGTPKSFEILNYIHDLDSTHAEAWRAKSTSFLKRGLPHKWKPLFDNAVKYDPKVWQPWRGYLYLWFYRDYQKAIADFNASDSLTPNFIDQPQGHSVDYWRGIAYLGLKDYNTSLTYFNKYIDSETKEWGEDIVEVTGFLYRGIVLYDLGDYNNALLDFDNVLKYNRNQSADAKYYKASILSTSSPDEALKLIESAIVDFNNGVFNKRPYVETMRQIYLEDLELLHKNIKSHLETKS